MSTGNAGAAVGLANSSKQQPIGAYVRDTGVLGEAGPGASDNYEGVNGKAVYDSNVLGEAVAFTARANSGAAIGKTAQWVTNTGALAAGTTRVAITAGVATADNAAGAYDIFIAIPAAGLAANKFFWAFQR